jgi:hypothetical protein
MLATVPAPLPDERPAQRRTLSGYPFEARAVTRGVVCGKDRGAGARLGQRIQR